MPLVDDPQVAFGSNCDMAIMRKRRIFPGDNHVYEYLFCNRPKIKLEERIVLAKGQRIPQVPGDGDTIRLTEVNR